MEKGKVLGKFLISRLRFNVLCLCSQRKGQCWAAPDGIFGSMRYFPSPAGSTGEGLQFAKLAFVSVFVEGGGWKGLSIVSALGKTKGGLCSDFGADQAASVEGMKSSSK